MSFGGFLDGGGGGGGGGGARIVADLPYTNNSGGGGNMPSGAIAPPRLITQSLTKSMFNSPGLSLALVLPSLPLISSFFFYRLICVLIGDLMGSSEISDEYGRARGFGRPNAGGFRA